MIYVGQMLVNIPYMEHMGDSSKMFKDVQRCSKCLISLAQIDQINSCDSWDLGEDSSIIFYNYYPSPNKGATF